MLAPPRDFSQLATSFFAFLRQGIPTHALSSLTIKLTLFTEFFSNHYYFAYLLLPVRYSVVKDRKLLFATDEHGSTPIKQLLLLSLSFICVDRCSSAAQTLLVGLGRLEPPTSPIWKELPSLRESSIYLHSGEALPKKAHTAIPFSEFMVGLGRLELPTSPLSGVRSNHLSYRPGLNWWSWSGSNRRPPECKSGALPAELQPLFYSTAILLNCHTTKRTESHFRTPGSFCLFVIEADWTRDRVMPQPRTETPKTPVEILKRNSGVQRLVLTLPLPRGRGSFERFQHLHPRSLLERR